jgi:hypothetical protein
MIQRTTRYFAVHPDQCKDFKAIFVPDSDLLPLDQLPNAKQLAVLSDGRVLIHALLGPVQLDAMRELAGVEDPLSLEAVETLGLLNSYLGQTPDEVRAITGQDFTKTVSYTDEETGEEVEYTVDLLKHEWR